MPAPASVQELVRRFTEHLPAYKSGKYSETQLRIEFQRGTKSFARIAAQQKSCSNRAVES